MSPTLALVLALAAPGELPAGAAHGPAAAPSAPASAAATSEPAGPAQAARDAYNAGRYADAAGLFLTAVQAEPRNAELYRGLARSRVWAKDLPGAVVAYRFYLQVAPQAADRDKVQAELDLALKQAGAPVPEGPPAAAVKLMDEAKKRAAAGDTAGALDKAAEALAKGYLDPALDTEMAALVLPLATTWRAELDKLGDPARTLDPAALDRLVKGYERVARMRPLRYDEAAVAGGAAGLLAFKAGRHAEAVEKLVPHAPADPRLRIALSISLLRLGRAEEAAFSLASLGSEERTVAFLLGLCQNGAGQDGSAALRRALDL